MMLQHGAGRLYAAGLYAPEPVDLSSPWPSAWTYLGPTVGGVQFTLNDDLSPVFAMEAYHPVGVEAGDAEASAGFALASVTARALGKALSGTAVPVSGSASLFTPGGPVPVLALGWESDEGTERWVYRKAVPMDAVTISRAKGAQSVLPVLFRALADTGGRAPWLALTADGTEDPA